MENKTKKTMEMEMEKEDLKHKLDLVSLDWRKWNEIVIWVELLNMLDHWIKR